MLLQRTVIEIDAGRPVIPSPRASIPPAPARRPVRPAPTWLHRYGALLIAGDVLVAAAVATAVLLGAPEGAAGAALLGACLTLVLVWPVLLAAVVLGLAVLYRYGPSRDRASWKWVTPGGIVAALAWIVVSMLFSWYVSNFGSYNETYGSLGAVIGFMTWIWLSTVVVLTGAEINAEVEHQTAEDTTEGGGQPLGTRGARMADTVGVAKA